MNKLQKFVISMVVISFVIGGYIAHIDFKQAQKDTVKKGKMHSIDWYKKAGRKKLK